MRRFFGVFGMLLALMIATGVLMIIAGAEPGDVGGVLAVEFFLGALLGGFGLWIASMGDDS